MDLTTCTLGGIMTKRAQLILAATLLGLSGCAVDTDPGGGGTGADAEPEAVEETVKAGGTVSSDGEDDGVTIDDPVETTITSPNGGKVTIKEGPVDREDEPEDFEFFGQQVEITAPDATAKDPLVLEFTLHESTLPEEAEGDKVDMFRNAMQIARECTGEDGVAEPDPCMAGIDVDGDEIHITALTSRASWWRFAYWHYYQPPMYWPPSPTKGEVDIGKLKADDWPVVLDGALGTVDLPFKKPVPGSFVPTSNDDLGKSVTLIARSDRTGATVNLTSGKLIAGTPSAPGEWSVKLNADRTKATIAFFNEIGDGLELDPDLTYEVQISISTNNYIESLSTSTFTVLTE